MNFIDLFNAVVKVAKPAQTDLVEARTMDDTFKQLEIDSLDGLVMLMYLCELYGVADTASKEWRPTTLRDMHQLLKSTGTKEPHSVAEAIKAIT